MVLRYQGETEDTAVGDSSETQTELTKQKELATFFTSVLSISERIEIQNAADAETLKSLLASKIPPMTSDQVNQILAKIEDV